MMDQTNSWPSGSDGTSNTAYGIRAYLPLPKSERSGIALCLSGGGYRAALFHSGSLRRLNEMGVLSQVNTITSVSGGSIFAAQLATHIAERVNDWPPPGGIIGEWEEGVAAPLRAFTRQNIRTGSVLSRFKPRNWLNRDAPVEALSERIAGGITRAKLSELPTKPRFIICSTDMQFGDQWVFDTGLGKYGSETAGYADLAGSDWSVADAVSASACVPGVFPPLIVNNRPDRLKGGTYPRDDRAKRVGQIELTDGGMYDNLGLEPVWRDHSVVLVSDGAPTFATLQDKRLIWRSLRHPVILLEQATEVRKRWLISNFILNELEGTFWSIGSLPKNYEHVPEVMYYSDALVEDYISRVRIDLDAFSEGEIAVLENHGYIMAEIAVQRHASQRICPDSPAPQLPHPEWMDERRVRSALSASHRITAFGRGKWR